MTVEVGSSMALREDQSKEELGALILREGLPQISGRTISKDTGWFPSSSCVPVKLAGSHVPGNKSEERAAEPEQLVPNFPVSPEHLGALAKKIRFSISEAGPKNLCL